MIAAIPRRLALPTVRRLPAPSARLLRMATAGALLLVAGIEIGVLLTMLPGTLAQWWHAGKLVPADPRPLGDWPIFYNAGHDLSFRLHLMTGAWQRSGLYSPGMGIVFFPFGRLPMDVAYRLYVALGAGAVLGVAYLAQRPLRTLESRLAVALGVVSLPELHWALRLGQLTPLLALAALGGFLLLRRHPWLAGVVLAVLTLKPQYAVAPVLYLIVTRQWRALAAMLGTGLALAAAGLAFTGVGLVPLYAGWMLHFGGDAQAAVGIGAMAQHHTWAGVLISAGVRDYRPLALDLVLLSALVLYVAWRRVEASAALPAAALGILLLTPYAMFYDFGLIAVAGALLVRARLRVAALVPALLLALYAASVATQAATPYPGSAHDGIWGHTNGFYWTAPVALAAVIALAVFGRRGSRPGAPDVRAGDAPGVQGGTDADTAGP
ncbi:MAG: glycosyltransferase family 87 protein [Dehalococcoidia bacterium]